MSKQYWTDVTTTGADPIKILYSIQSREKNHKSDHPLKYTKSLRNGAPYTVTTFWQWCDRQTRTTF